MSTVGPLSSVVVAAVTVIFYIVSTATNYWVVVSDSGVKYYYGLWEVCTSNEGVRSCASLSNSDLTGYDRAARGLMLTAVIFAGISWILALAALIGKVTGKTDNAFLKCLMTTRFSIINGLIFGTTVLLVLIGTTVYAAETNKDYCKSDIDHSFGYSIIIGWISIPLGVLSATMLTYFFRAMGDDA